jgi:hypothetical protein
MESPVPVTRSLYPAETAAPMDDVLDALAALFIEIEIGEAAMKH